MRFAGLGVQLAASIVVFLLLGRWADRRLGTEPLFTLLGPALGFGGTMWSLVRSLNQADRDEQADRGGK